MNENELTPKEHERIESQQSKVLKHLQSGKSITPIEALNLYNSFRLSALIFNLKALGHNISCERYKDPVTGKRYGKYSLIYTSNETL